jgi:hypothetical protein
VILLVVIVLDNELEIELLELAVLDAEELELLVLRLLGSENELDSVDVPDEEGAVDEVDTVPDSAVELEEDSKVLDDTDEELDDGPLVELDELVAELDIAVNEEVLDTTDELVSEVKVETLEDVVDTSDEVVRLLDVVDEDVDVARVAELEIMLDVTKLF